MSSFKEHHPACPKCESPCDYEWIPSVPHGILKDGPSGSWPSKGERFKKYRAKQSEAAEKRQNGRFASAKDGAIPNYKGEETGTWKEAQQLALADRGAESAATYAAKVEGEKKPS